MLLYFLNHNYFFLLDIIEQKMQGAKSEPNLGIIVKQGSVTDSQDDLEENKENFEPDQFNNRRIK